MQVPVEIVGTLFVIAGVVTLVLLPPAVRNRRKPGGWGFVLMVCGIALWCVTAMLEIAAPSGWPLLVFSNLTILGASLTVAGWLILGVEFAERITASRWLYGLAAVDPVVTQVFAWTNPWHGLVYGPETRRLASGAIHYDHGLVFLGHAVFAYLVMLGVTLLLVSEALISRGLRRRQCLALIAGWLPPALVTTVYLSGIVAFPVDPTPLSFALTAVWFGWALFRNGLLNVAPVARKTAIERIDDAFVTIGERGRVVDCNQAARDIVDCSAWEPGVDAADFFGAQPDLAEAVRVHRDCTTAVTLTVDGEQRHFQVDVSPVGESDWADESRVVLLRDITPIKRREQTLRERERDLDLMRQVLTRTLRHNIRNKLYAVQLRADTLLTGLDGDEADIVEQIRETSEAVVTLSEKARQVEAVVEQDGTRECDLVGIVGDAVAHARDTSPDATIDVETPTHCAVTVHPEFRIAIDELLENAIVHAESETPTVTVEIECPGTTAVLTITDEGPGIPRYEVEPLENARETPLEHGSGIGLWLVKLVTDRSDGTVEFEQTATGTRVTVRVPLAAADSVDATAADESM